MAIVMDDAPLLRAMRIPGWNHRRTPVMAIHPVIRRASVMPINHPAR